MQRMSTPRPTSLQQMKLNWKSLWPRNCPGNLVLKVAALALLMGLAFRVLFPPSVDISPDAQSPVVDKAELPVGPANDGVPPPAKAQDGEDLGSGPEKCDLFKGDWIPNPSGPVYTNGTCRFIESPQNCMTNGRPDTGYLYWRWNPRNCELLPFDAGRFLDLMRDKAWALIGDSISRNHGQSLLCMLSTVERPELVYHDEEYRSRTWRFRSYNFSFSVIWSPFLVKAAIFEDMNGVSTSEVELHLDRLDAKWTSLFPSLDYVIISTGKWFLKNSIYYENGGVVGCHNCDKSKRNVTELGFDFAYRKVLHHVMDHVTTSGHKGLIFFRTSTPDHFENGEWHNGGMCPKTVPGKEGEIELKELNRILLDIELGEFEQAKSVAEKNGVNLNLLDFTNLNLMRPDGHPGPYRQYHPFTRDKKAKVQNDCLHWCLPGPIDAWNDVIMDMVLNST